MEKPILYISGAITGKPDLNRPLFAAATKTFRDLGFTVVNPHELCQDLTEDQWQQCMRRCITAMMGCDVVVMLDGWRTSRGAMTEYQLAIAIGIEAFDIELYLKLVHE